MPTVEVKMAVKSRITFAAKETNGGKLRQVTELHAAYCSYTQTCISLMVADRKTNLYPSERRTYFPPSPELSSQIKKNAQAQAVSLVQTWHKGLYGRKLAKLIRKDVNLTDQQKHELRCIGKYAVKTAGPFGKTTISQEMIDLFGSWVWDEQVSGSPPTVDAAKFAMQLTETTCVFEKSDTSSKFDWFIRLSTLTNRKRVEIPLASTPYLKEGLAKSVLVKPDRHGWRLQFSEELPDRQLDGSKGKVGLDVGLNCLAATSDGRLYGRSFKPTFDLTYAKVKQLRANRQRQGLKDNSPRLQALETKLSGQVKTATGTVANKLIKSFPDHTFVVEDLDLRGCKGQKRFAYRQLQFNLATKAVCEVVNPAYTSQMCPSCGFVSRNNRRSTKFACKSCGRSSHADVVGATNLLGRSKDKQIRGGDRTFAVKHVLWQRYRTRRDSSTNHGRMVAAKLPAAAAPAPSGRGLTVRAPSGPCIVPKSIPSFA